MHGKLYLTASFNHTLCPFRTTQPYWRTYHLYLGKHARWLDMVYPHPTERSDEDVLVWLKTSKWGRCAWKCDNHATSKNEFVSLEVLKDDGYQGHGGGDFGLVNVMDAIFRGEGSDSSLIENSIEGHLIGFAAEESRLNGGTPVRLDSLH